MHFVLVLFSRLEVEEVQEISPIQGVKILTIGGGLIFQTYFSEFYPFSLARYDFSRGCTSFYPEPWANNDPLSLGGGIPAVLVDRF